MGNQKGNKTDTFDTTENSLCGGSDATVVPKSDELAKEKEKYTKTQLFTLITLLIGNFCSSACYSLQAPFFPTEAEKKGATASQYGIIFGIYNLSLFLTASILGKIVLHISPKLLANAGVLINGITCIFFGTLDLIRDTTVFVALALVIRIIEGIATAAVKISCYNIISSQFGENMGTALAVLETFAAVGHLTGPSIGGALYDLGGYRLPFWALGATAVIDAILIYFFLHNVDKPKITENGSMLKFWLHPRTLLYSFCIFTSYNYIGFNHTALEPHLRVFSFSGFQLGLIFTINVIGYAVSAPVFGYLCDRKCSSVMLNLLGCIMMVFSLLLIGPAPFFNIEPQIWIVITSLSIMGLALGCKVLCAYKGNLEDTLNRGYPPNLSTYGLASSMRTSSQSLGAFVGPSVGGYLLDNLGFRRASMTLLVLETVLVMCLIVSICSRGSRIKKADLTNSTKEITSNQTNKIEERCNFKVITASISM